MSKNLFERKEKAWLCIGTSQPANDGYMDTEKEREKRKKKNQPKKESTPNTHSDIDIAASTCVLPEG